MELTDSTTSFDPTRKISKQSIPHLSDIEIFSSIIIFTRKTTSSGSFFRPVSGDTYSLSQTTLFSFDHITRGVIMTVSEDEDERLAQFLESEVLSEISDQVNSNRSIADPDLDLVT